MGAPNRGPSDSWDGKDDSLWAVFINVLELAVLETLGDAVLGVEYFFRSSMCATILATDTVAQMDLSRQQLRVQLLSSDTTDYELLVYLGY